MQVKVDGRALYLNHFPFLCFAHGDPGLYSGDSLAYQAFGHVHSGPHSSSEDCTRLHYLYPTQYDVGVDNNNYMPVSWADFESKIKQQVADWSLIHSKDENV